MSEKKTVAVVMSTYNGEQFLREQIDSVLAQAGDFDLSLWVRDDGSQDGTLSVLESYADRLHLITGKNLGPAGSFLDLLRSIPEHDYYAFADQDDVWMPEKLAMAASALSPDGKPGMWFSDAELVDEKLNTLGRSVYRHTPATDFRTVCCAGGILGCTAVINLSLARLIREKPLPEKVIMHDFYAAELCLAVGGDVIFHPGATVKYRQHGENVIGVSGKRSGALRDRIRQITKSEKVSIAEQAEEIIYRYGNTLPPDNLNWLKKIGEYRRTPGKRLSLALSRHTKYASKNMGLTLRLAILFGRR